MVAHPCCFVHSSSFQSCFCWTTRSKGSTHHHLHGTIHVRAALHRRRQHLRPLPTPPPALAQPSRTPLLWLADLHPSLFTDPAPSSTDTTTTTKKTEGSHEKTPLWKERRSPAYVLVVEGAHGQAIGHGGRGKCLGCGFPVPLMAESEHLS